jgi:hypothetical protein
MPLNSDDLNQINTIISNILDQREKDNQYQPSPIAFHKHNGTDSPEISYNDLTNQPAVPITPANGGTGLTTLTAHNVLLGEGVSSVGFAAPGTAGQVLTSNGATSDPTFQALAANSSPGWFGDGSDGTVSITTGTTTLTRDQYFDTLSISNGATLKTNGYRVFCKTSITIDGTLDCSGSNGNNGNKGNDNDSPSSPATGGTGATVNTSPTIFAGAAGGNGGAGGYGLVGAGVAGGNGVANNYLINPNGAGNGGGKGGSTSVTPPSGGTGGSGTYITKIASAPSALNPYLAGNFLATSAGNGGGGGGDVCYPINSSYNWADGGSGGGGGASGGILVLAAKSITISATGVISANGGNGGSGGVGGNTTLYNAFGHYPGNGGGGGGGGNGGVIFIIYSSLTNNGSITAYSGSGGTGGTAGTNSGLGGVVYNGVAGTGGTGGQAGLIYQLQV